MKGVAVCVVCYLRVYHSPSYSVSIPFGCVYCKSMIQDWRLWSCVVLFRDLTFWPPILWLQLEILLLWMWTKIVFQTLYLMLFFLLCIQVKKKRQEVSYTQSELFTILLSPCCVHIVYCCTFIATSTLLASTTSGCHCWPCVLCQQWGWSSAVSVPSFLLILFLLHVVCSLSTLYWFFNYLCKLWSVF